MVAKRYKLFGSEVEFFINTDEFLGITIMDEAYELALKLQKIFNLYDKSSEISRLNKLKEISASKELIEVLKNALKLCNESKGQFDISLGKMFLDRKQLKDVTKVKCSYKHIELDKQKVRLLHEDVIVDLGSIAKGYIADKIADYFISQGIKSGYIDARGDLKVFGDVKEIGIKHPRKSGLIHKLEIKNTSIATSGDYKQFKDNYSESHIINQKDIISATVISKNLMDADLYATILMVCDPNKRDKLINKSGFPAFTVDKELRFKYYNEYEKLIKNEA